MVKNIYLKPAMEVCVAELEQDILGGSVTSVTTNGLDALGLDNVGDALVLPGLGQPTTGNIWNDAW